VGRAKVAERVVGTRELVKEFFVVGLKGAGDNGVSGSARSQPLAELAGGFSAGASRREPPAGPE
jgi:hypothetical protein